jgi:hypothetical protein
LKSKGYGDFKHHPQNKFIGVHSRFQFSDDHLVVSKLTGLAASPWKVSARLSSPHSQASVSTKRLLRGIVAGLTCGRLGNATVLRKLPGYDSQFQFPTLLGSHGNRRDRSVIRRDGDGLKWSTSQVPP